MKRGGGVLRKKKWGYLKRHTSKKKDKKKETVFFFFLMKNFLFLIKMYVLTKAYTLTHIDWQCVMADILTYIQRCRV